MKFILILLFGALQTSCGNAQVNPDTKTEISVLQSSLTYEQWKKDAASDIRLYPKFGDAVKDEAQLAADQALIEDYTKQQGSRRKGSEVLVGLGFNYLYRGDVKTAMYRFNQAWLLDPENENAFWGFASVYFSLKAFDLSLKQLNEGLKLNPKSSNILTDIGTIHMTYYQEDNDEKEFKKAMAFFTQSYDIDPKNTNTLFKRSAAYLMHQDCTNALKYYNECKALGSKLITEEYVASIEKACKVQ